MIDLAFVSASNLARMPEGDYLAVVRWIDAERQRLARQGEQAGREVAAALRPELVEQAKGRAEWVRKNWSSA